MVVGRGRGSRVDRSRVVRSRSEGRGRRVESGVGDRKVEIGGLKRKVKIGSWRSEAEIGGLRG